MNYYEVLVSSQRFHGNDALTYSCEGYLKPGQVVVVPLQRQKVLGIVKQPVNKPSFAAKEIIKVVSTTHTPQEFLNLITWLRGYYPAPLGQITSLFLPASLAVASRNKPSSRETTPSIKDLPPLTPEQISIVNSVKEDDSSHFVLHGDTGSGKTRVYLELASGQLQSGKSVLLLTPEIGLTPQLAEEAAKTFGDNVIILHSNLTPAKRRNAWLRTLESNEPLVIIGPRSALFSPLKNIGLIVLDEFHDSAYKQEQPPHYLASRVAAKLANLHSAKLILGSATPPVSDYYMFKKKGLPILRMTKSAIDTDTMANTDIEVVNLRDRDAFTRSSWLSTAMLKKIEASLSNNEQSLVFLNRRGTARLVICHECSWQALCPRCDLPLTYHGDTHRMKCHTCGFSEKAPAFCPNCNSTEITFKSIGTKAIYEELARLFPKARLHRFDSDTKKSDSLELHYESIKAGNIDIIIGTQLLAKGLDLPKLSVVGVVVADTSMYFPDYTAEEKTYQMINQIIGRVNRGHRKGTVVVQTYYPESPVIQAALQKDYEQFYEQQVTERQSFNFPPFNYMLKVRVERSSRSAAQNAAQKIADDLRGLKLPVAIAGPSPAFTEKNNNRYRWQLLISSKNRQALVAVIHKLPANSTYDIDPIDLL